MKIIKLCRLVILSILTSLFFFSCGDDDIEITSITINYPTLNLKKGEAATLAATITPSDATNQHLLWNSSNETVAVVTQSGLVNALSAGTAIIQVSSEDGKKNASCTITVTIPVSGVTINKKEVTIAIGETGVLIATVSPDEAQNKRVSWSSSNKDIVSVSSSGEITGLNAGESTITVTTDDMNFTASCIVKVLSPNNVDYTPYDKEQKW